MDFGGGTKKTPPKRLGSDFIDVTIMSTPRPQASSTVERKTFSSHYSHADLLKKISHFEDMKAFDVTGDSSLGLVNNISNLLENHNQSIDENVLIANKIETERELARELLERCGVLTTDKRSSPLETDKENDVNAQNLCSRLEQSSKSPILTSKLSMSNVLFEPSEFTARSSELKNSDSDNSKMITQSKCNIDELSFNSTAAELMAKFADEDFLSGSRMSSQLAADELLCRQNFNAIPTQADNNHLEFSCFSGIMGDIDLTIDSRTGQKVSVGEYFSRKCDPLGQLSHVISDDRPKFGLSEIKSPERIKSHPLANITSTTIASNQSCCVVDNKNKVIDNNDEECTIMSLSKIAQALQSAEDTPRRLVDQLLKVKARPESTVSVNCTGDTYTVEGPRTSLPVLNTSSSTSSSFSIEINKKSSNKLSLDSKTLTDSINDIKFNKTDSPGSYLKNMKAPTKVELLKSNISEIPFEQSNEITSLMTPQNSLKPKVLNHLKDESSHNNHHDIKSEQKSVISLSRFNEKIIIGKNTEELYKCIVGTPRVANIEIQNESERWLICKLRLQQIQGDKNNVEIAIPKNEILLEPRQCKSVEITINLLKDRLLMASLAIDVTDMSTHETVTKNHMMCFVPQELRNEKTLPSSDVDECEIRIVDTDIPIILKQNEIKCLKIKNISKEMVQFSAAIVQNDETRKFVISLEPKKMTLNSGETNHITIQYQGTINNNNTANVISSANNDAKDDGEVSIKIKTVNETYLCPIIIKANLSCEENRTDGIRCDTPQHLIMSTRGSISPSSPQSTTSTKSGRNSPRSTTSGTVTSDTIPIKSTHSSLVWTSVRVGKHETRDFTIRNASNNKIKLQAVITDSDNSFRFLKDRDRSTTINVGLQHMESKTFTVIFSPNSIGAAAGRITFMNYDCKRDVKELRSPKVIPLFGHGGYAKVSISQALKIMGDQMWLSLGKLSLSGQLNSRIKLENSGDLPAYAKISLVPKTVYPSVETSWLIEPTKLILGPKEIHWVTVQFRPHREDLAILHGDVVDLGTLTITHGDEPTRWRIRKLYQQLTENGQMRKPDQDDIFSNIVCPLCEVFPGETPVSDLSIIRDTAQDLGTLCRGVNRNVVTLTMELNVDDSIPIFHDDYDANDSQLFQSLRSDVTMISVSNGNNYIPSESSPANNFNPGQHNNPIYENEFTVSPTAITLTPPLVHEATIMVTSSSSTAQPFETVVQHNGYLCVTPSEGMVPAGRSVILKVECQKDVINNMISVLQIYTANERRDIGIRIVPGRR